MKVILLKDVENLGTEFDLVKVKAGYGRNYLIPKGLAMVANDKNLKVFKEKQKQQDIRNRKLMEQLEQIRQKFEDGTIKVGAKVGTSEKIFGSITNVQLADAIKKQLNIEVDRKKIVMPDEVKTIGVFPATVALDKDVKIEFEFEVVGE